jgi:hypothetical protein
VLDFISAKNIHIHLDWDVLDPEAESLALCKTPNGISIEVLMNLIENIRNVAIVAGYRAISLPKPMAPRSYHVYRYRFRPMKYRPCKDRPIQHAHRGSPQHDLQTRVPANTFRKWGFT